ncbi:hypothetical protein TIFTF001_018041 [Ficus carica]|uniref:ENT domain-containing protein n=1 Tax=Ficus carica TaxID=3494 RepID=A0AA88AAD7_FICCA|nr:hypothetical protein TIFTF001_018041 [Ficus carica]
MKFKEGSSVEVLRKERDLYGSWYSGIIIGLDGDYYVIRYKFLVDQRGDLVVERVLKKNIRPQPPQQKRKTRWAAGDVAEVFDSRCWRVGKVAKVLRDKRLVFKFFGSIQLKEFHVSSLRIHQVWHENKWSVFVKVQKHKQEVNSSKRDNSKQCFRSACSASPQEICEESCSEDKDLILNKDAEGCYKPMVMRHSLIRQVGDSTSLQVGVVDNNIKAEKDTTNYWIRDSNECSVASCSLNETSEWTRGISRKINENVSHGSDAESAFPSLSCKRNKVPSPEHQLEVDIHNLELQAYKSTVQALFASGPLSWEQESLLTNLRLSLHISNDEHLQQLRHLLSAQVL